MGTLEIIRRNGEKVRLFSKEPFCTLKSAAQNSSLMGDDNVQLSIVSSELLNLGKGDKIIVEGEEYTIRTKVNREMLSDNHYVHDATFYGVMYELMKSLYRNTDANGKSSKSTFDLTYNIRDFVKVLIYNVSRDYPGLWAFDEANCPDTEPRTISFARNNCLQVLQMLCSDREFDLEFLITQKDGVRTIHIGKFGAKVVPPGGNAFFEWGKGNGLYKLKEQKVDDKTIITRLWVEGGTTNIRSDYRDYSERLQLPFPVRLNKKEHKLWDGTIVPPQSEYIGISDDNKRYLEDGDLRDALGSDEDAVTYDNIFPKRTGTVTALVVDDINSFIDDTMDFDLNEKDDKGTKYLINEVSAKITFISGKLAGQQFELAQKGGYDHATKRFTLIPFTDNRGLTIPTTESEAYRITEGDTYKITDIHLPKSYEDDAEEDLWYAGYNEFKPRTQARAQYQLTFERSYFLNALPSDSETTVFHVGNYVPVKDERFGIEKNIRIQKVTKNLLVEHDYTLTLSDITAISPITQTVVDVGRHETIIENNRLRDLTKARRGWRTTEELRTMVYDTDGYFDPENIKPNSIDTNMLTVGSKSQQFVLIDVILQANVNGISNRFDASAGVLAHLTIDDEIIKHWNMAAGSFTLSSPKGYYVFAKCSKKSTDGIWYVTQEQLKVEPTEDPNNYYFQVGILGSVHSDDDFRDFTTTYGFTRINGNTITTGKIITSDKECYLDLDGNKFRIGDSSSSIDWNVTAKRQLTLHNVRLLSDSGDTSHIGVFRGTYNPKYVYYAGDEVTYTANGETCTYRYTNPTPSMGNLPTNSVYWSVVAKGSTGDKGEKGDSPVLVYRGIYDSSKTYYGNSKRLDAVKYNNQYYIARIDAGTFTGFVPTNTGKWNTFGAQFETIATNLLLAEGANIGDWFIKGGKIVSTMGDGNRIELDASMARIYIESSSGGGDYALVDFGAKMTIDANRGIFETRAKNAPNYSNAVSYMSPTGIFSNMAGTDGMPASSGYTHRGAIVGLGFANVPARTWNINAVDTIVAGVYGRASNSGTAPAFGGFFYDLFAGGLIFGRKCITGTSNNTWYLNREDTVVIGYTSAASVVYLPASPKEGQVIFVKQWWRGYMRFRPRSGYLIYDDTSVNDYYDFVEGQGGMFVYTVGYVDGVKKQAWLVSRWKY